MPNGGVIYRRLAIGGFVVILIVLIALVGNWKQFICKPGVISQIPLFNWLQKDYCPAGAPAVPPWIYFLYGVATNLNPGDAQAMVNQLNSNATTADKLIHQDNRFNQCCCSYSADATALLQFSYAGSPPGMLDDVVYNGINTLPNSGSCPGQFVPSTVDVIETTHGTQLNQPHNGDARINFVRPDGTKFTGITQPGGFFQFTVTQFDSDVSGNSGGGFQLLLVDPANPTTVIVISQGAIVVPLSS